MNYGSDRFKSTWQAILYGVKGYKAKHGNKVAEKAYLFDGRGFDVMIYPSPTRKIHPAEKPLQLIKKLIHVSSNKNDIVLDPFLGSGVTLEACLLLKRNFIGIEIDGNFCKLAYKRIERYLKIYNIVR